MSNWNQAVLTQGFSYSYNQTLAEAEVISKSSLLIYLASELGRHRGLAEEHLEILRHPSLSLVVSLAWQM